MKTILNSLIFILTFTISLNAQNEYKIGAIGFYNFENLFDTLDTPNKIDEDFTPMGALKWNTEHYQEKIGNLAKVISEVATNRTPDGLALLGVAEIENQSVLEDFVNHPLISKRNYKIVHYESPDVRGIDVALLYQEKYFKLKSSKKMPLLIHDDNGDRIYTRDILLVEGMYDGDLMYVMVNHWPSRRGGEEASQPYRNAAALLCKNTSDSILAQHPEAKIIIMGDLNDDPVSPSVSKIIRAKKKANSVKANGFFNPMYTYYRKGYGTLAYRDAWNLFDQILISEKLAKNITDGYYFYKAEIFNPNYLVQKQGRFKGYPFRTFSFGQYLGGYSDHFPVCVYLIKKN